jgi:transposase-like protein
MARLVAQWRASGASQATFARQHGIPTWTLWYWCRKLSSAPPSKDGSPAAPTFVPVHLAADPTAAVLEVVFSGGERLQIRPAASPELVRAAVAALRAAC